MIVRTILGDPGFGALSNGERRYRLNRMIEAKYRRNGVLMYSDLDVEEAIARLTGQAPPPREVYAPTDEELMSWARWHDASLLTAYLDGRSPEFQRDLNQYGVYVWIEIVEGREVPLMVEAVPKYVGESRILSSRLRQHANGVTVPAQLLTQEYLAQASEAERAAYRAMNLREKRAFRKECVAKRGLFVRTTHCNSYEEAMLLEDAMTRHYEGQGYSLWNIHKKFWKNTQAQREALQVKYQKAIQAHTIASM